jgi:hypothetical protein
MGENLAHSRHIVGEFASLAAAADSSRIPAIVAPIRRRSSCFPPAILAHSAALPVPAARKRGGNMASPLIKAIPFGFESMTLTYFPLCLSGFASLCYAFLLIFAFNF